MKLVVFDVDGTLIRGVECSKRCYAQAFEDVAGIADLNTDWDTYDHVTDDGVACQAFRERLNRAPEADELVRLRDRFVALQQQELDRDRGPAGEVPGANSIIEAIDGHREWVAVLASGAWEVASRLRRHYCGLRGDHLPGAYSENGPSREEIVHEAVGRALRTYGCERFDRIVCVGDGLWDLRTAARLGLPFIGVASGLRRSSLAENGASHVLEDFRRLDRFVRGLQEARVPAFAERN